MKLSRFAQCAAILLLSAIPMLASAASSPGFAISATNVTLNASGQGISNIVITGSNGYTGTLGLICSLVNSPEGSKTSPICQTTPPVLYALSPSQSRITSEIPFIPAGSAVPAAQATQVKQHLPNSGHHPLPVLPAACCVFSTVILAGLLRGRKSVQRVLILFVSLAGFTGFTACGAATNHGMTPGIYTYSITIQDGQGHTASTTTNVTVPGN